MKQSYTKQFLQFFVCLSFFLSGCIRDSEEENSFQTELSALKMEVETLKRGMRDLQQQIKWDKSLKKYDEIAFLTPETENYSTIKFDLGVLTVSLNDIVEYANGSKVTLQFGNPLASTINGLKATIDYGEVNNEGLPKNETAKTKDVVFNEAIKSGTWTSVQLVLDGIIPSKLGFVRVKDVRHTGIRLLMNHY